MAILSSPLQYITSIPPATRFFACLLVLLPTAFSWFRFHDYKPGPYFLVVPGFTIWYPWTLVTAAFVETNLLQWVFTFITVIPSCKYFEKLWGSYELVKFTLITVVLSNFITVVVSWLEFAVLGREELFLYGMSYEGMTALQTGILVAFTQLIPEHQVQILGVLKIRVKRLPMIYVTISTVLCLVGYQNPWILIQFGWLVSWAYLRFYKRNISESGAGGESYGDRSETFAFVHWFPPFLHAPISIASNAAYSLAVRLRIVRPFVASADVESGYNTTPGGARAEAERRRAMALKALDQRMANNTAAGPSVPNPSAAPTADASDKASRGREDGDKDASSATPDQKVKGAATDDVAAS